MKAQVRASFLIVFLGAALHVACSSTVTGTGMGTDIPFAPVSGNESDAGGKGSDSGTARDSSSVVLKRAFVTSREYGADLRSQVKGAASGIAAADALCQLSADGALLGGRFQAYLADDSRDAADGLADVGPWFRISSAAGAADPNGKVFNNKANLSTKPIGGIDRDEQGGSQAGKWVWTGDSTERSAGPNCANWTSPVFADTGVIGESGDTSEHWRAGQMVKCDRFAHLYCFEQ